MALLVEYALSDGNRWGIQVILQTLSLLSNVPLRLLDWERTLQMEHEVHPGPFLGEMDAKTAEEYKGRENSGWVTAPVRIHPLVDCLRRNKYWLAGERRFVRRELDKSQPNGDVLGPISYFNDSMKVAAVRMKFPSADDFSGFLVAGPVFTIPIHGEKPVNFGKTVEAFVVNVVDDYGRLGFEHDFDPNDLRLRGRATGWIYDQCLVDDARLLGDIVTDILTLQHDPQQIPLIKNVTYYRLAQYVHLLHKDLAPQAQSLSMLRSGDKLLFLLDQTGEVALEAALTESAWSLALIRDPKIGEKRVFVKGSLESHPQALRETEALIVKKIGQMGQSLAYRFHGYAGQKVRRLWSRLQNEVGVTELDGYVCKPAIEKKPDIEKSYHELTRRIEGLFSCDLVTVYLYNRPVKTLIPIAAHIQPPLSPETRSEYLKKERASMEEAASDMTKRERSVSYRAVDTGLPRFCKALFPGNGQPESADPPGEYLLDPYLTRLKGRCAIAVPMNVNGLIFGVLEIVGSQPYQFREDFVQLAQGIADMLGPFLHHREMLSALAKINEVALDEQMEGWEKHKVICERAASIFLADACTLWIPPLGRPNEFELSATFNRPDTETWVKTSTAPYVLSEDMKWSMLIQAFDNRRRDRGHFFLNNVDEWARKHKEWIDQHPLPRSVREKYQYTAVVPVVDPKTGKNLCALSLYYVSDNGGISKPEADRWQYTARFMSHYIAISIAAINTRSQVEDIMHRILAHEMRTLRDVVGYRAKALKKAASSPEKSDVDVACEDLDRSLGLMRKFADFYRPERFIELVKSGKPPIFFLYSKEYGIDIDESETELNLGAFLDRHTQNYMENSYPANWETNFGQVADALVKIKQDQFLIVYLKLLENVVKYADPGTVVRVGLERREDCFEIDVRNRAICLPESERLRLGGYGIRGSNVGQKQGTGLGLNIAHVLSQNQGIGLKLPPDMSHTREPGLCDFTFRLVLPFSTFLVAK
ncbi:MAG: ATP-binding protein [Thermodesulfobacteriota bacterium]